MKHGSLFSGIGGFDLAAEWMGWENVFHCEIEPFPRKILNYYWPNSISYHDVKTTDFSVHRGQIEILTGGFPCQPYSAAGKRLGKEDDRHLWPYMLEAIRSIQPRWIVGENVRGLVNWSDGLVFEEVQADLEAEGYEVQAFILPAASVGAPHRRDRVWFVAKYTDSSGFIQRESEEERTKIWEQRNIGSGSSNGIYISEGPFTDSNLNEYRGEEYQSLSEEKRVQGEYGKDNSTSREFRGADKHSYDEQKTATDTESSRVKRECFNKQGQVQFNGRDSGKIQTKFQNFPTQSPICGGDDGLPSELDGVTFPKWRNESIKGYGNAVVPQVVLQIFKAIEKF